MATAPQQSYEARRIEFDMMQAAQLSELAKHAADLARLKRMNLSPLNQHLLWAEWHYAKALHNYLSTDDTEDLFMQACHELSVDEDGEPASEQS